MATTVGRPGTVTVIGDTVNVAARLEKAAGPGEVLCGRLTVELAGRGAVSRGDAAGAPQGEREPVEAWEALGLGPPTRRREAAGRPPLVGRDDELAFLRGAVASAVRRDRRPGWSCSAARRGPGKTRLASELARARRRRRARRASRFPRVRPDGGARVAAELSVSSGRYDGPRGRVRVRSADRRDRPACGRSTRRRLAARSRLWAFAPPAAGEDADQPLLIVDRRHAPQRRPTTSQRSWRAAAERRDLARWSCWSWPDRAGRMARPFPSATTVPSGAARQADAATLAGALRRGQAAGARSGRLPGRAGRRKPALSPRAGARWRVPVGRSSTMVTYRYRLDRAAAIPAVVAGLAGRPPRRARPAPEARRSSTRRSLVTGPR